MPVSRRPQLPPPSSPTAAPAIGSPSRRPATRPAAPPATAPSPAASWPVWWSSMCPPSVLTTTATSWMPLSFLSSLRTSASAASAASADGKSTRATRSDMGFSLARRQRGRQPRLRRRNERRVDRVPDVGLVVPDVELALLEQPAGVARERDLDDRIAAPVRDPHAQPAAACEIRLPALDDGDEAGERENARRH